MTNTNTDYNPLAVLVLWMQMLWRGMRFVYVASTRGSYEAAKDVVHNNEEATWLFLPQSPFVFCILSNSEDVRRVMGESQLYVKVEDMMKKLEPSFGHSLLNLNTATAEDRDEVWKQKRLLGRLINQDSQYLLETVLEKLIADIDATPSPVNIRPLIQKAVFTFMVGLVYGKDLDKTTAAYRASLDDLIQSIGMQLNNPFFPLEKVATHADECTKFIQKHFKEADIDTGCRYPVDLYRALGMAGYSTIISQLGNTLHDLASCEKGWDFQQQMVAVDELDACTLAVKAMKATGAKMPPAPTHLREAAEDDVLPGSGAVLKEGTQVMAILLPTKNDNWDPEVVHDERMFGHGPRACTGRHLATRFVTHALAKLTATYKIRVEGEPVIAKMSLLYEFEHLPLTFTRRVSKAC